MDCVGSTNDTVLEALGNMSKLACVGYLPGDLVESSEDLVEILFSANYRIYDIIGFGEKLTGSST